LNSWPEAVSGARRVIAAHGWQEATMARIAAELGCSRMTLHRRGVTRAALVESLRELLAREHRDAYWPALIGDGTGRERLERALRAYCDLTERTLDLFDAIAAEERDAIYHVEGENALTRSEFTDPIRRLLLDGAADGSLRTVADVDETATVLYNVVGWTYWHLRVGHRWSPGRATDAVVGIAIEGVAG
jgi:AcrR family transcriptional regulator